MDSVANKWGNSIGVRIPQSLAKKAKISEGTPITIDIEEKDERIVIYRKKYTLENLLSQISPDNTHREIETGKPVGKEEW